MLSLFRTLSLRYLQLHVGMNALVVMCIALGVICWVATGSLYTSLEKSIVVTLNPLSGYADLQVVNDPRGVPRELKDRLARVPGVKSVQPLIVSSVHIVRGPNDSLSATLLGIEVSESDRPATAGKGEFTLSEGAESKYVKALLLSQTPVIVGQELDTRLPADEKKFKIRVAGVTHELTRVGTVEAKGAIAALGSNVLVMGIDQAEPLVDLRGRVSRMDIALHPGADLNEVKRLLQEEIGGEDVAQVSTPQIEDNRIREALAPLKVGTLIVSTGSLVVGMFLVFNTLSVSVAQRRHDIGVLRSVGATRAQIRNLFLMEAALLGLIGAVLGVPLGLGLAKLLLGSLSELVSDALFPVPMMSPTLSELRWFLVSAVVAGIATSVVAALVPAIGASSEEPADAVRRVPPGAGLPTRLLQLATCFGLVLLGVGLATARDQLPDKRLAIFGGVGCIFLASFLATALFSAVCARLLRPLAQRLLSVEGRLAADNLVRAPGRTGLVIAALAAGVALMTHTAGVIRSNEKGITDWLERHVTADLIVTSGGPVTSGSKLMSMREDVRPDLEAALPTGSRTVAVSWSGSKWTRPREVVDIIVALVDADGYYEANRDRGWSVPKLELFHRLSQEPNTTVVSDNFADLNGVGIGDTITLPVQAGGLTLTVIGTVEDYAAPRGLLFLDRNRYKREFHAERVDIFDVYLPKGADAAAIAKARADLAQASVSADHSLVAITGADLRREVAAMIHRLHSIAYLQEGVVGLVAGLGVVAALMISVLQRRRELGLLRAVGSTQGQVLRTVLFEALLMGLIGGVLGVAFGLLLEWYALHVVMAEEAGFRFAMLIPWQEAGLIALASVVTATLAGLLPAVRAVRLRIADAIAYE
jgi:putative ABC transport system permease protein